MESLNLNTLASSLPNGQQNAEKELLNDFKAAALSITTLYRSSRKNAKRAYNAGYAAACQDQLNFIQQGVSAIDIGQVPSGSSSHAMEGSGMSIGRIMDWTEARLEAIKAREEEEDEDEEREKDRDNRPTPRPTVPAAIPVKPDTSKKLAAPIPAAQVKEPASSSSLPTPNSPASHTSNQAPSEPSSPSPPPTSLPTRSNPTRPLKSRPPPTKESFRLSAVPPYPSNPTFFSDPFDGPIPFPETPVVIGSKRRHAVMRMLDSVSPATAISIGGGASSTVSSPGGGVGGSNNGTNGSSLSKRRTRSSRNITQLQPHNPNISVIQMNPEDMDIEEDEGRERKRIARR